MEVSFSDPTGDKEAIAEARRFGIRPVTYTYQNWDREEARQVFMGVSFVYGERQATVDTLPSIAHMEAELVGAIRAVRTPPEDRKQLGILQGNGEPAIGSFPESNPLGKLRPPGEDGQRIDHQSKLVR